jgi:hypothetical protein
VTTLSIGSKTYTVSFRLNFLAKRHLPEWNSAVLTGESAVGGVVLEHVDHVVEGNEGVVDCDDLYARLQNI